MAPKARPKPVSLTGAQIEALLQLPEEKLRAVLRVLKAEASATPQDWWNATRKAVMEQEGLENHLHSWEKDEPVLSDHYERLDPEHEQNKTDTRHTIQRPSAVQDDDDDEA